MKTISVTEFKNRCLALLEEVQRTSEPIEINKRGRAIARVVPVEKTGTIYPQQTLRGTVKILGDIVGPTTSEEDWDAYR